MLHQSSRRYELQRRGVDPAVHERGLRATLRSSSQPRRCGDREVVALAHLDAGWGERAHRIRGEIWLSCARAARVHGRRAALDASTPLNFCPHSLAGKRRLVRKDREPFIQRPSSRGRRPTSDDPNRAPQERLRSWDGIAGRRSASGNPAGANSSIECDDRRRAGRRPPASRSSRDAVTGSFPPDRSKSRAGP